MSPEITTALIAAGSALAGYLITHLTRKKQEQRELTEAQLTHVLGLQDRLTTLGQNLMDAAAAHMRKEMALERDKYLLEEEVRDLKRLNAEQDEDIKLLNIECQKRDDRITYLQNKLSG